MYSLLTGLYMRQLRLHTSNIVCLSVKDDQLISLCSKGLLVKWSLPAFEVVSEERLEVGKVRHAHLEGD